jgi:alpha-tubulin suppressor-like RCC1 family protein
MPQNVMTSILFTRLGAGDSGTCGVGQSGVYCWGYLPYDPTSASSSNTPKQLTSYTGFSGVTVGSRFACFVTVWGSSGENDCQGIDNVGQLGVVDTPGKPDAPSWMPHDSNKIAYANFIVGTSMNAANNVIRSSAGSNYVCGDLWDGTVRCMGSNSSGQLGTSGGDRADAEPVVGGSGAAMQLHGVTAGSTHACALDASGYAWCWGLGRYGETGNGTGWYNQANYARQVSGGITFRSLAAGYQHTCGIGTDNNVYCWGDNEFGQLGVGYHNLGFAGFNYVNAIATPQRVPAF